MKNLLARHSPFRIFFISGFITLASLVFVYTYMGPAAAFVALMLMVIEVTFSFDNAIINARVLATMSPFWQRMFITVGMLIAVFGMRIIFPIVIVMLSAGLSWGDVIHLAFNDPDKYAEVLHHAHPSIASFGGMFLLMLTLHFFFDNSRTIHWLGRIERPMQVIGRKWLHAVVCTFVLVILTFLPFNHYPNDTLIAGLVGILTYAVIHGASEVFTKHRELSAKKKGAKIAQATGVAGFISFMYLEVLDASFSFDGVIGAFAVTKDVILIAIGLGVGALWVRSLTLYLVHHKVLDVYRYLEHGAHYVIGILAATLLAGLFFEIPEAVAGLIGIVVISLSIASSIAYNKLQAIERAKK
ncbi:MAG TPA: DUF475 domain-containing protein [Candidatus Saccharimonadales bacterium]|nr:DUF475 domain-containing protein [Candidatus Saccharimonadales bacterium]